MIESLRWFPMPSLGSFVAEDSKGTVLVAPMNADGTRSTYEGEVGEIGDSREVEQSVIDTTKAYLLAGKVADAFRSVLRSWLNESELLEIDARNARQENPAICHSHDFCDANMAMLEAFELVTGRPLFVDGAIPDANSDVFNAAWTQAKADGFATWAPKPEDLEKLEQIAANADLGVAHESDANWLRLFVDRLKASPAPRPFDASADGDRKK